MMIRLENLTKVFHTKETKFAAVKNVSLEIKDGEIFGIIGFSGAGKSTLVRCINLLERPTEGAVYFGDTDLMKLNAAQLRSYRQKIGMIFQQFNLLSQRTVFDNIMYPLEVAKVDRKKAKARVSELLELVGLADKANSYPSQLSGGQKQRVAIARALATSPQVLLCDEATSALDPITTKAILNLLKDINQKLGVTIVIITHEMKVVEQVCDRVAIMSAGRVEEIGSVKEVFVHPQSEIGKKLILPGENTEIKKPGRDYIRIVFNGQSSFEPVIADLVLETGVRLNILGANTADIGGNAYGQMFIEKPTDKELLDNIKSFLSKKDMVFEEVEVE